MICLIKSRVFNEQRQFKGLNRKKNTPNNFNKNIVNIDNKKEKVIISKLN